MLVKVYEYLQHKVLKQGAAFSVAQQALFPQAISKLNYLVIFQTTAGPVG